MRSVDKTKAVSDYSRLITFHFEIAIEAANDTSSSDLSVLISFEPTQRRGQGRSGTGHEASTISESLASNVSLLI